MVGDVSMAQNSLVTTPTIERRPERQHTAERRRSWTICRTRNLDREQLVFDQEQSVRFHVAREKVT